MISKQMKIGLMFLAGAAFCLCAPTVFAAVSGTGVAKVAENVTANLGAIAKLITAASYVAGFGFAVGAIIKFKAHKDNPQQITLGVPIAMLAVAAALMFIPTVFKTAGSTLFGASGVQATTSGVASF